METENKLKEIWLQILKLQDPETLEIKRETNFFDIGGTSLFIGMMIIMIRKVFGVSIETDIFFENPTLGGIADEIRLKEAESREC